MLLGGPQEEGRRAGTENVAGVLAMTAALEARESAMVAGELDERSRWRDAFVARLKSAIPGIEVLGIDGNRLWNTVSIVLPEIDCRQRWVVKLDKGGAAVSTGSACASGEEKPSHVLSAMGLNGGRASRVVRVSSGWETTTDEWERLGEVFERVYGTMVANRE
jgi:cysteine desulfurase